MAKQSLLQARSRRQSETRSEKPLIITQQDLEEERRLEIALDQKRLYIAGALEAGATVEKGARAARLERELFIE